MIRTEAEVEPEQRFLLTGIRWRTYVALRKDLDDHGSHIRMTYDRGDLEIMSPGVPHEGSKHLLGRMVNSLTEVLDIPVRGLASLTLRRKLKKRGLEPDECYWVQHEAQVRGKRAIDLDVDPPPDIAIEVEISRSILDKLPVYAALKFPEVWRCDGKTMRVARLQPDGSYAVGDASPTFPWLPMDELARWVERAEAIDETTWIRAFRDWVRDEVAPRRGGPG